MKTPALDEYNQQSDYWLQYFDQIGDNFKEWMGVL